MSSSALVLPVYNISTEVMKFKPEVVITALMLCIFKRILRKTLLFSDSF